MNTPEQKDDYNKYCVDKCPLDAYKNKENPLHSICCQMEPHKCPTDESCADLKKEMDNNSGDLAVKEKFIS